MDQPRPDEPLYTEPGRTPGSAEGGEEGDPKDAWREPGRTAGQAEGDRETIEEDLRRLGLEP